MLIYKPWRVRLTDPDDVATYGGRWWLYDEAAILRLPWPELAAIEAEIFPTRLKWAMEDSQRDGVLGDTVALWVAMRIAADPEHPAPAWAQFKPLTMLADWQQVPDEEADPGAPLAGDPPSSPSTGPAE